MKFQIVSISARQKEVAPHAGAWIEIETAQGEVRGQTVAPHAGAWIEIRLAMDLLTGAGVAPHAGAWIEISSGTLALVAVASLPTRERGLKLS